MVKQLLLLGLLLLLQNRIATGQVAFVKTTSVSQLLAKADKEGKFIFIDGYTDWCGWCKVLDEKVFCAGPVADTMNKYFVSTKLEMEKDSIGVLFARKYAVTGFPTALVLNTKGQLVAFLSGYSEQYLNRLMPIITAGLNQPIQSGYSDLFTPEFPGFYLDVFPMGGKERKPPRDSVVNSFLATQSDITNEVSWNVINRFYYKLNNEQQDRIIARISVLKEKYGSEHVQDMLNRIFTEKVNKAIKSRDEKRFNETLQEAFVYLAQPEWFVFNSKLDRHKNDSNWKAAAHLITSAIKDTAIGLSPATLNQYAWDLYETSNDTAALKMAIQWMEDPVLVKDPQYNHLDTYAALLYKSGQLKAAQKAARKAIEVGKQEKQKEMPETVKLLKKIDAALLQKKE
jgi:thioredoxin-related protein